MNPTPEAVAAALALVDGRINGESYAFMRAAKDAIEPFANLGEWPVDTAARILAAEVRRLRLLCEAYADQSGMRIGYDRSHAEPEKIVYEKLNQPSQ